MSTPKPPDDIRGLRWDTVRLGWAIPLVALVWPFFVWLTFSAPRRAEAAEGRRGALVRLAEPFTVLGINIPLLLVATWLAWLAFRMSWRWVDQVAVEATSTGLRFHKSLLVGPYPWDSIEEVSFRVIETTWSSVAQLEVKAAGDKRIRIRPIMNHQGAAEAFAVAATLKAKQARNQS